MKPIKTVNIIGMGALGLLYGALLTQGPNPAIVTYVMDTARYERHKNDSYTVNGEPRSFSITTAEKASSCDLLIVAVKYPQLAAALDTMATSVGEDTVILSVMNGISSEEIIGERFGMERMLHAVALGMDAMHFGSGLLYTKAGKLFLGVLDPTPREKLDAVTELLDRTSVGYTVEEDILHRIWSKFMINVGINQTCMVYDTCYAGAMAPGSAEYVTLIGAMREVILIANAEGIALTEQDLMDSLTILKSLAPDATPSMGQDRINKRPSEVELFAGTVLRFGEKHGIPVPANDFLYRRVREIESAYQEK